MIICVQNLNLSVLTGRSSISQLEEVPLSIRVDMCFQNDRAPAYSTDHVRNVLDARNFTGCYLHQMNVLMENALVVGDLLIGHLELQT